MEADTSSAAGPFHVGAKELSLSRPGRLLAFAMRMRASGAPDFPDPSRFPSTTDMRAPAYRQALAACGALPLGLRH